MLWGLLHASITWPADVALAVDLSMWPAFSCCAFTRHYGTRTSHLSPPLFSPIESTTPQHQETHQRQTTVKCDSQPETAVCHFSHLKCSCGVQQVRSTSWPAEVALAVVLTLWSSFVLSLSFLDTLIRSNAPFVRRAIDRDIGRSVHMFSLLGSSMRV
jgi:hypothetical protein